jgi:hypothetical protein
MRLADITRADVYYCLPPNQPVPPEGFNLFYASYNVEWYLLLCQ